MATRVLLNGKELFPRRFFGGDDLKGRPRTVTIARVGREEMYSRDAKKVVVKPTIYFKGSDDGKEAGFVLGTKFATSIAEAIGNPEASKWIGKTVTIYPKPTQVGMSVLARPADSKATEPLPMRLEEDDNIDGGFEPKNKDKTILERIWDVMDFHEVDGAEAVVKKLLTKHKGDAEAALAEAIEKYGAVPVLHDGTA